MSAQPVKSRLGLKIGIVLVLLAAIAVGAFYQFRPTATVVSVKRATAADLVPASVVVHAQRDLQDIKSEFQGRVIWIDPRQLGQPFKAGEPIVRLDVTELERKKKEDADAYHTAAKRAEIQRKTDARVALAKEALANAEKEFKFGDIPETQLRAAQRAYDEARNAVELQDFDLKTAETNFENAQAALQRQIDKMTIVAPVDCILNEVNVAVGALIGSGTTIARYYSMERVVIAKVSEEDIGRVQVGQPAKVRLLNLGGKNFDATVTTILPFADPETQRYSVYLDVKTDVSNLLPFSTGEASITAGEHRDQPLIPRRALFNDEWVYVVNNGVVEKRKVTLGYKALNFAEVTSNLKEGDLVIVNDVDQFRDGQHVRVENAD